MKITCTNGRWFVDFTLAGRRYRERFADRAQAEIRKMEIARARATGDPVGVPNVSVGDIVARWEAWLDTRERSPQYRKRISVAKRALAPVLALKLRMLSKTAFDNYVAMRKAAGRAGNTIGAEFRVLHSALEFAVSRDVIARNPLAKYRLEKPKERVPEVPSPESLQRIFDAVRGSSDADRGACLRFYWFALATGMRFSEIVAARGEDVRNGVLTIIGKGGYQRAVTLPALPFAIPESGHILVNDRGAKWKHRVLLNRLQGACVLANEPVINLHTLRHAHATFSLAMGQSLHEVMSRCGWRSFSVMQRYVTLSRQWRISGFVPNLTQSRQTTIVKQQPNAGATATYEDVQAAC